VQDRHSCLILWAHVRDHGNSVSSKYGRIRSIWQPGGARTAQNDPSAIPHAAVSTLRQRNMPGRRRADQRFV